jgi:hypothetical protein
MVIIKKVKIDVDGSGADVDDADVPDVSVEDGSSLVDSGFLLTVATGKGGNFMPLSFVSLPLLLFVCCVFVSVFIISNMYNLF